MAFQFAVLHPLNPITRQHNSSRCSPPRPSSAWLLSRLSQPTLASSSLHGELIPSAKRTRIATINGPTLVRDLYILRLHCSLLTYFRCWCRLQQEERHGLASEGWLPYTRPPPRMVLHLRQPRSRRELNQLQHLPHTRFPQCHQRWYSFHRRACSAFRSQGLRWRLRQYPGRDCWRHW